MKIVRRNIHDVSAARFRQSTCSSAEKDRAKLGGKDDSATTTLQLCKREDMSPAHSFWSDEYASQCVECGDDEHDPERETPPEARFGDPSADNRAEH